MNPIGYHEGATPIRVRQGTHIIGLSLFALCAVGCRAGKVGGDSGAIGGTDTAGADGTSSGDTGSSTDSGTGGSDGGGTGDCPQLSLSTSTMIFAGSAGTSTADWLVLWNDCEGKGTLEIESGEITSGTDVFALASAMPMSIEPGAEGSIEVSCTPPGPPDEDAEGRMALVTNDPDLPEIDVRLLLISTD